MEDVPIRLPHPGAATLPTAHMAQDTILSADKKVEAEISSDEGSGEYKQAFEDIGMCPLCGQKGLLYAHCKYCEDPEIRYSVVTKADNFGMNETDKEHEVAIACAKAFSRDIAEGAQGAILANVEVEDSTESNEANSEESNQSSPSDWAQVNQVGNEEQKVNEWLIDSGASVHVTNQKEDLWEPTGTAQAVTIGSGKAMAALAIGIKPTMLYDALGNIIELADTLYIPEFKKKIISLSNY